MTMLLRSALFNLWFYGLTTVLALAGAALLALPRAAAARAIGGLARGWSRLVLGGLRLLAGIRYEVSGREHLPAGPVVIASMHQSAFDTLIWLYLLPHPAYVLKRELMRIPLFGALCRRGRMIVVDRRAGARAIRGLLADGAGVIGDGRSIVIFPEGTRVAPGSRAALQPGVAALAARLGVPVVPVVTDSGRFWGRRAFRKRAGVIHVVIRPALPPGLARGALMARLAAEYESGAAALGTPWPAVDNSVGSASAGLPS